MGGFRLVRMEYLGMYMARGLISLFSARVTAGQHTTAYYHQHARAQTTPCTLKGSKIGGTQCDMATTWSEGGSLSYNSAGEGDM